LDYISCRTSLAQPERGVVIRSTIKEEYIRNRFRKINYEVKLKIDFHIER
jgi:hypothetical protein